MFDPSRIVATPKHTQIYGLYEKVYTLVDFLAAAAFVVGSALFFSQALATSATWMFLVGSLLFAARPTVTVVREFHLDRLPHEGHHQPGVAGTSG